MRVLILGGTGEARLLAARLDPVPGVQVVSSLAGRVRNPALPVGEVRIGGFGGADGLAAALADVDVLVDATHPFAASISRNAAAAAAATGTRLLALRRPAWAPRADDRWEPVGSVADAAALVAAAPPGTVLLTTGRRDLAAFAGDDRHDYVIRTVDPPEVALPPRSTVILDRGPYTVDRERELIRAHGVSVLVTKNSGGALTEAKLTAARELNVRVVMVERPPLPEGVRAVDSVEAVLAELGLGTQDAAPAR
jgi:precorrin-6A/cobalt-precorrin-6A reductase